MTTKNSQSEKEYVTRSVLKETAVEIVDQAVEQLGQILAKNFDLIYKKFDSVDKRFDRIEGRLATVESTMATKQDILNIMDKMTPVHQFEALAVRVNTLEEKVTTQC